MSAHRAAPLSRLLKKVGEGFGGQVAQLLGGAGFRGPREIADFVGWKDRNERSGYTRSEDRSPGVPAKSQISWGGSSRQPRWVAWALKLRRSFFNGLLGS